MSHKDKDMYLPVWLCGLGIGFLIATVVLIVFAWLATIYCLIAAIVCLGFGVSAILCWKNQWSMMVDNHTFIYSTMFGRKIQYHFSEIRDLKEHSDSATLILENGKVHIERCAIMSDRFVDAINVALKKYNL